MSTVPSLAELSISWLVQLDDRQLQLTLIRLLPLELIDALLRQLPAARHPLLISALTAHGKSLDQLVSDESPLAALYFSLQDPSCDEQLLNAAYRGDLETVLRQFPLVEEWKLHRTSASTYDMAFSLTSQNQHFLTLPAAIASGGHIPLLELLPGGDEDELLMAAGAGGHLGMVEYLLARYGHFARTLMLAMTGAAANGEMEMIDELANRLADYPPRETYQYEEKLISLAARNGQVGAVELLTAERDHLPSVEDAARGGRVEILEMAIVDEMEDPFIEDALQDALWQAKGHPAATAWLLAKAEERGLSLSAPNDVHALNRLICDRGNCVDSPACLSLHRPSSQQITPELAEQFDIPWLNPDWSQCEKLGVIRYNPDTILDLLVPAARFGLLAIVRLVVDRLMLGEKHGAKLLDNAASAAIHGGHLAIVEWIVRRHIAHLDLGHLVEQAAEDDRLLILKLLLAAHRQPEDEVIRSGFIHAAKGEAIRILHYLSSLVRPDQELLDQALSETSGPKTIQLLLGWGANPSSAILEVVNKPIALDLLLKAGGESIPAANLNEALGEAIQFGERQSAIMLIQAGADIFTGLAQVWNARQVKMLFEIAKELRVDVSPFGKVADEMIAKGKPEIAAEITRLLRLSANE